ncbi:hypothetical protein [Lentilactobacillus sunkii]|uniref:hypothetical protein n=1 Tax=Lentilactobacillus sunkii TaxID=481719 RepID=UPI000708AC6F|nr:hypothetical protein [Lentilactobacillus sunkii]
MNLLDLFRMFKKSRSSKPSVETVDSKTIKPTPLEASNREKLKRLYKNKGFKTIPQLPSEQEAERIVVTYRNFPASLVPKEYMDPIELDGNSLLRGDIVALWWTTSRKNISNPPQYFLYEYGVDYYGSLSKLKSLGLLTSDDKLTESGETVVQKSKKIIWQHKAAKTIKSDGTVKYSSSRGVSGKLLVVNKAKYPKTPRKDYLESYFVKSNQRIQYLWESKQYELCEKEALEQVDLGNKFPAVYSILAMLYRKQKRYQDELDILKKGVEAQISIQNPGVAIRDFRKRIIRVEELINK